MSKYSSPLLRSSPLLQLPEDFLVEVLLKLPVESLITLRSVCKRLARCVNTYISSKPFVRSHLELWRNHDFEAKNVFIGKFGEDYFCSKFRAKRICMEFASAALNARRPPGNCRFLLDEEGSLQFGGCQDGIICLYEFRKDDEDIVIYICNPALQQCKIISRQSKWRMCGQSTKVCLVPVLDDYKVVVVSLRKSGMLVSADKKDINGHVRSKVCIYSLNDCCWRDITAESAGTYEDSHTLAISISDLVVHNQCIYWMINTQDMNDERFCNVFKVLDLRRESVREIILPHYLRNDCYPDLIRYKGRLAVCFKFKYHDGDPLKVFVMEEEGGDFGIKPISIHEQVWDPNRYHCKVESGLTSWGYCLQENNVYVVSNIDNSRLDKFLIPDAHGWTLSRSYVTADYIPSLVPVFIQVFKSQPIRLHSSPWM